MSPSATKVYEEYLALPDGEREKVAALIIESIDANDECELSSEWAAEIQERIKEIDEGKVELVEWDEFQRILKDEP